MTRIKFATATALAALAIGCVATGVQAADLVFDVPEERTFVDPPDLGLYALLYGGVAFKGNVQFDEECCDWEDDYGPGPAVGGAIGVRVVEGLSVELDVFHTHRALNDSGDWWNWQDLDWEDTISTTSLMVNGKFTLALNDVFDVYAGAGVGGIWLAYNYYGETATGMGAGYQVMIGASANVTENIAIFGELRHQNSFSPIEVEGPNFGPGTIHSPVNAALLGVRLSM
jgi:opacity protein-like surface antigen